MIGDPASRAASRGREAPEARIELPVYGMTCDGCATTVRFELGRVEGVSDVDVDVAKSRAVVTGKPERLDEGALRARVEQLGYHLQPSARAPGDRPGGRRLMALAAGAGVLAVIGVLGTLSFRQASNLYLVADTLQRLTGTFSEISAAGLGLALLFGVIVAFAPSTYAMAPAVMGYVTGAGTTSTRQAAGLSSAFVGGVVAVDAVVGALFALGGAAAMRFFTARLPVWYAIITIVLVLLGLINLRVWRPKLPSYVPRPRTTGGAGGAFALGVPFGLMACPSCTPLLLPVALGAAATGQPWYGAALMAAFALGRGVPLVVLGTFTGAFKAGSGASRWVPRLERAVGVLLLAGAAWFLREFLRAGGFSALL
jgi:cytochrome c-type biogenesis protein